MRVTIDADRCQGHQMCAVMAPDLFGSDDLGNGIVLGDGTVPAELQAAARQAVLSCPEQAISVED
jgi:ferredoxin